MLSCSLYNMHGVKTEDDGFNYMHHCGIFPPEERRSKLMFPEEHSCMTLASPTLHVADMANIREMFSIPQSPLRLPISFTFVLMLSACALCLFTGNEC